MVLTSPALSGNARLRQVSAGAPSVKKAPPNDDLDAVQRIQRALVDLGFPLPLSTEDRPNGQLDGIFGDETESQVIAFQKQSFPSEPDQWDGRVGQYTLAAMDALLSNDDDLGPILPIRVEVRSRCAMVTPAPSENPGPFPVLSAIGPDLAH